MSTYVENYYKKTKENLGNTSSSIKRRTSIKLNYPDHRHHTDYSKSSLLIAMALFILFHNDQLFHSIEEIQRHSERQLPDQVSVDDAIPSRTWKQRNNHRGTAKCRL